MANICDNDFLIYGYNEEEIIRIYLHLQDAYSFKNKLRSKEILSSLGCPEGKVDTIDGRTELEDISLVKEGNRYIGIRIIATSAWGPCEDFIKTIIDCVVPGGGDLEYEFVAVEPGCEIYINTDKLERFYKELIYINIYSNDYEFSQAFTNTVDDKAEVLKIIQKSSGVTLKTVDELEDGKTMKKIQEGFNKLNPGEDFYLDIHFFES